MPSSTITLASNNNNQLLLRCIEKTISAIEAKIVTLVQGQWRPLQQPNESFPGWSEAWSSSRSGHLEEEEEAEVPLPYGRRQSWDVEYQSSKNHSTSTLRGSKNEESLASSSSPQESTPTPTLQTSNEARDGTSPTSIRETEHLTQGLLFRRKLEPPHFSIEVNAGTTNLQLSWSGEYQGPTTMAPTIPKACWIEILWYHSLDQLDSHGCEIVDLGAIEHESVEKEAGAAMSTKDLVIREGEEALRVKFTFDNPASESL